MAAQQVQPQKSHLSEKKSVGREAQSLQPSFLEANNPGTSVTLNTNNRVCGKSVI